jgi:hypothetical protein
LLYLTPIYPKDDLKKNPNIPTFMHIPHILSTYSYLKTDGFYKGLDSSERTLLLDATIKILMKQLWQIHLQPSAGDTTHSPGGFIQINLLANAASTSGKIHHLSSK